MSPLDHLPYGIFSTDDRSPRVGVLVDDRVLDLADAAENGAIDADPSLFASETLMRSWRPAQASGGPHGSAPGTC